MSCVFLFLGVGLPLPPSFLKSKWFCKDLNQRNFKPFNGASLFAFSPLVLPLEPLDHVQPLDWLASPFGFPKLTMTILFLVVRPPPSQPPQTPIPIVAPPKPL